MVSRGSLPRWTTSWRRPKSSAPASDTAARGGAARAGHGPRPPRLGPRGQASRENPILGDTVVPAARAQGDLLREKELGARRGARPLARQGRVGGQVGDTIDRDQQEV